MSKDRADAHWDARRAFHLATMEVYLDLGRLVAALTKEPSRAAALFMLRQIASQASPVEPGDSEQIAEIKTAVARLRSSLATVEAVRKKNRAVRWDLGMGEMVERCLGGISCASFHDCVVAAADEMITTGEPQGARSDPHWFVNEIIKDVSDKATWTRWQGDLEREHHLAQILPLAAAPPEPDQVEESRREAKPNVLGSQSSFAITKRQWREAAVTWLESIALASHLCIDGGRATLRQGWRDGHHPWPPPRAKFAGIRWGSDDPADWAEPTKLLRTRSLELATEVNGNTKQALLEFANLLNERDADHAGPTQEQVIAYERAELLVTATEQAGGNSQPGYPVTNLPAAPPTETTSTMSSATAPTRTDLDEHIERAFDLLRHYQGLICDRQTPLPPDYGTAIDQLEGVLRQWLPQARAAGDPVINGVAAIVGNREEAATRLREVDLWQARIDCLQRLATEVAEQLDRPAIMKACRRNLEHWRTRLPRVWTKENGQRAFDRSELDLAQLPGMYWSSGVASRPSILGASYSLAATCDALAAFAHAQGLRVEARCAIQLARDLRERPTWVHLEVVEIVSMVDQQMDLARDVEVLLTELELMHLTMSRSERDTGAMTTSMTHTEDGHRDPGSAANGFYRLALSLLDLALSIVRFRQRRDPEWADAYPSLLPDHLRAALTECTAAENARSGAKLKYEEALQDHWYGELGDRVSAEQDRSRDKANSLKARLQAQLKTELGSAEKRFAIAKREEEKVKKDLPRATMALVDGWLSDRVDRLRSLLRNYRAMFADFRPALAGLLDRTDMQLGQFGAGAASACEVLLRFANGIDELGTDSLHSLDPNQLRVAVEKEIGFLVRQEPTRSRVATEPTRNQTSSLASHLDAPSSAAPSPQRVSYADAVAGRPDLSLPRTPKTTLARWIKAPPTATDLGVNPKGKVNAQMLLVDGLLRLHAQKKTRRLPPQMRPE